MFRLLVNYFNKYKEIVRYLIVGVLTTIVSLGTYYLCVFTFLDVNSPLELQIANVLSWIAAVTFAYITNRIYVFESKQNHVAKEIFSFYVSRLSTLGMDMFLMFLGVTILQFNDTYVKLFIQVIVTVANYVLSKLFVFKS